MNLLQEVQKIAVKKIKRKIPQIKPGLTVKVHQRIKEGNKERVQIFEGLVIKVNSGHGADKSFTVRKLVGGIGVEKIFPLYSPKIEKIQITKSSKIRRAKLYYMRKRSGKSARLKESFVSKEELENMVEASPEEEKVEKVEKTEKQRAEENTAENITETPKGEKTEEKVEAKTEEKAEQKEEKSEDKK